MKEEDTLYRSAQEQLDEYVASHVMRFSAVRNMVLQQVCKLPQPFTAAQLIEACKTERISVGTVYNVLNLFIEAKLIKVYDRGFGQTVTEYELITAVSKAHMQIVCRKCGRKAAFYDKAIMRMVMERKYSNFNVQNYTLVVYGECKICRRLAASRQRKK